MADHVIIDGFAGGSLVDIIAELHAAYEFAAFVAASFGFVIVVLLTALLISSGLRRNA